jgi:hypothetical protein
MSQIINYPRSDSRIISLFIFISYVVCIFPFVALKNILFLRWKLAFRTFAVFIFIGTIVFSGFLIFQVNMEASERYLVGKYENKLDQLIKENQDLEVKFSKANSINGALGLAQKINFEKITQISYIKLAANKVVKK